MDLQRLSLFLVASFISLLPSVLSQQDMTSSPSCVLASFQWSYNSHHQSPCAVAASLFGACNGGSYQIEPLTTGHHYLGPSLDNANPCQCSTVAYSMMQSCGACQNGTITSWSVWSTNCAKVFINSFPNPIPEGTSVPGWAYLDVKSSDTFDPALASGNANLTESSAIPQPPSTSTSTQTPSTTSSTTISSAPTPSSSPSLDPQADAIGSGVVGGVIGLAVILALVAWLYFRRRQKIPSIEAPETTPESPVTAETKEIPSLVVCPPSLPYKGPTSPGGQSNSPSVSDSDGSLKQTLSRM